MNLATLERMVGEGDLSRDALLYLLNCRGECEWLDFKETLSLDTDFELCAFARDVLAMKNVGGGYIVLGVRDRTWMHVGLPAPFPYDTKHLRDQVRRATGLTLDVDVVGYEIGVEPDTRRFAIVLVRASKKRHKRRSPTLVAQDFCGNQKFGLRRGEIYVRRGDSTERIGSGQELADLLDRLEANADEDLAQNDARTSPFAVENGTYRLLEKGYDSFVGRSDLRNRLLSAICGDPRIWLVNVHGPGGVGKSALATWAAYELYVKREFEAVLQLTGKETILTDAGIRKFSRSLYSLENLLDHILMLFEENTEIDLAHKKTLAIDLLSAWKTLIVLDNMETVSDGRILAFVQSLPPSSQARVVLTSRQKSGGWEMPIPVSEMNEDEISEFIRIKSKEMNVDFPTDAATVSKVVRFGGGLPLATQWIVGQFKRTRRLDAVFASVVDRDSPVLEFSFRNVWSTLSHEARTSLALMSILDTPTTIQELQVCMQLSVERLESALAELGEVTLVTKSISATDGRATYSALPITLSFAKNELSTMGELEVRARQRLRQFNEQMELQASEVQRFRGEFDRFGLEDPNVKRAAILCRRAESEMFSGNDDSAELLFRQAHELAPNSAYVLAKTAIFELAMNRLDRALTQADEACSRSNAKTGALCHMVKARVLDALKDYAGKLAALQEAVRYAPDDPIIRHQYGVSLSLARREEEAIRQFSLIIENERRRVPPRESLTMALYTRIINLQRIGKIAEAKLDVQDLRDLVTRYPHLARSAEGLRELE